MFTQLLGTAATAYGVLAALTALLQTRQLLARRTSCDVSARFLASYAGGYAIWLTYGLSTGSLPLIVVDTAGLLCGGLTLAIALSLRGSLIRPATWNSCNSTSISQRPAAPGHEPNGRAPRLDAGRREGRALGRGRDLEVVGESFYQDNLRRWLAHAQASRCAWRSQPSWQPRTTIPTTEMR